MVLKPWPSLLVQFFLLQARLLLDAEGLRLRIYFEMLITERVLLMLRLIKGWPGLNFGGLLPV